MTLQFPAKTRPVRLELIKEDVCPECGGSLDTGWECNDCDFDARPELAASPASEIQKPCEHCGNDERDPERDPEGGFLVCRCFERLPSLER